MKLCAWSGCLLDIEPGEPYQMIGLDRPYYNVFFHKDCFNNLLRKYDGWDGIVLYLARNPEIWYNRSRKRGKRRKN